VRPLRSIVPIAAAALLLAGCGGSSTTSGSGSPVVNNPAVNKQENGVGSLSADEILARAKTALTRASSVHLVGQVTEDGDEMRLDLRIKGREGGIGIINVQNHKIELVRVGQTVYMRTDENFWASQIGDPAVAKQLAGKYLKGPVDDVRLKQLANFTDMAGLADLMLKPDGKLAKGERKTVNGIPAIGLVDDDPKDPGVLYVAVQGEPYPLQLAPAAAGSNSQGSIDFVDYGKSVQLTAPSAAEVIDASKLGQPGG